MGKQKALEDAEVDIIYTIVKMLERLDKHSQQRVIEYLGERYLPGLEEVVESPRVLYSRASGQ